MRPVSAAFLRTVAEGGSHGMVTRATVCSTYQTTTTPTGTRIDIIGGDVKLDGTAEIRSTLELETPGQAMWPEAPTDLLTPYGNEIYVERGVRYSDLTVEYVGLGYFRTQEPGQDEAPNGPITISGRDRMAGIIDGRLLAPVQFTAGTTVGAVMSALILEVYPSAVIEWDDATDAEPIPRSSIASEDRYEFLDELIKAHGKIWYWDHRGALVIKSVPDPTEPVLEVRSGEGGVLVKMSRKLTRDGVYNAVVASGEGADTAAPVRGVAVDDSPTSPTYFYGRFGPVPRFYSSPFLGSDAQAFDAASSLLRRNLGLPYSVDFTAVPNPALEPWDAVRIRADRNSSIETHVLESLTIPLVANAAMPVATRQQSVVLIGTA